MPKQLWDNLKRKPAPAPPKFCLCLFDDVYMEEWVVPYPRCSPVRHAAIRIAQHLPLDHLRSLVQTSCDHQYNINDLERRTSTLDCATVWLIHCLRAWLRVLFLRLAVISRYQTPVTPVQSVDTAGNNNTKAGNNKGAQRQSQEHTPASFPQRSQSVPTIVGDTMETMDEEDINPSPNTTTSSSPSNDFTAPPPLISSLEQRQQQECWSSLMDFDASCSPTDLPSDLRSVSQVSIGGGGVPTTGGGEGGKLPQTCKLFSAAPTQHMLGQAVHHQLLQPQQGQQLHERQQSPLCPTELEKWLDQFVGDLNSLYKLPPCVKSGLLMCNHSAILASATDEHTPEICDKVIGLVPQLLAKSIWYGMCEWARHQGDANRTVPINLHNKLNAIMQTTHNSYGATADAFGHWCLHQHHRTSNMCYITLTLDCCCSNSGSSECSSTIRPNTACGGTLEPLSCDSSGNTTHTAISMASLASTIEGGSLDIRRSCRTSSLPSYRSRSSSCDGASVSERTIAHIMGYNHHIGVGELGEGNNEQLPTFKGESENKEAAATGGGGGQGKTAQQEKWTGALAAKNRYETRGFTTTSIRYFKAVRDNLLRDAFPLKKKKKKGFSALDLIQRQTSKTLKRSKSVSSKTVAEITLEQSQAQKLVVATTLRKHKKKKGGKRKRA